MIKENKAYILFKGLSRRERKRFELFLSSSLLSEGGSLKRLYQFYLENEKAIDSWNSLTKRGQEKIKASSNFSRKTHHLLVNAIKQFWVLESTYQKDPKQLSYTRQADQKIDLLKVLLARSLNKEFSYELRELKKILSKCHRSADYYHNLSRMLLLENEFQQRFNPRENRPEFDELLEVFQIQFAHEFTRIAAAIMNQNRIIGKPISPLSQVIEIDLNEMAEKDHDTKAYLAYGLLESGKSDVGWGQTMEELYKILVHCSPSACKEVLELMLSFAVRKINSGILEYFQGLWEVYQLMIDLGYLDEYGSINPSHFINLIQLGVYRQEDQFVENIMKKYGDHISDSKYSSTTSLAKGIIALGNCEFESAEIFLSQTLSSTGFEIERLVAKAILMRTYFDQGKYLWILEKEFNAQKMSLHRKIKKTKLPIHNIYNFIRITAKLSRILSQSSSQTQLKLLQLKDEIGTTKELLYRRWLIEKINHKLLN